MGTCWPKNFYSKVIRSHGQQHRLPASDILRSPLSFIHIQIHFVTDNLADRFKPKPSIGINWFFMVLFHFYNPWGLVPRIGLVTLQTMLLHFHGVGTFQKQTVNSFHLGNNLIFSLYRRKKKGIIFSTMFNCFSQNAWMVFFFLCLKIRDLLYRDAPLPQIISSFPVFLTQVPVDSQNPTWFITGREENTCWVCKWF